MPKYLKMINKKSQAWGIDLMVAATIFLIGIIIFFVHALNSYIDSEEESDKLYYDGNVIAELILSEGHPEDWDGGNVVKIGIISDNRINETKLERFYNLAENDYQKTKELFNTKYDYYFFREGGFVIDKDPDPDLSFDGIPNIDIGSVENKNLLKIARFTIYKNEPTTVYLYLLEE